MKGLTPSEMAEKLNISVNTIRQRIQRLGIKPISQEALYPVETLKILEGVKMGRPKKEAKVSGATAPKKKGKNAIKQKTH